MNKTTIYILIATLVVLGAWLGFEAFHTSQETTLPEIVQEQIESVDPELSTEFLDELEKRQPRRVGNKLNY